ncbi:thiamine diphosphokinase [uncultured Dubosiella sp.]|uniref:thiamine diphosphokinase n=1 Tax=uncultured Dubosiella sp. TaxID=1937011 RepID=UPI0025B57990|nr:thiamine diphosphokinase [uncultured Dubosiella sp.]
MKTAILATPRATDIPVVAGATYIGVDAGALRLQEAGIAPAFAVGDFDSMSPDALEQMKKTVPIERHPVMKDESDAELAVAIAKEKGFDRIVLAGAFGGRVDHTIANLRLLAYRARNLVLYDQGQVAFCLEAGVHRLPARFRNVSFFALEPSVITLEGFLYPLDSRAIDVADIYTLSNSIVAKEGIVTIASGAVLCVMTDR